MKKIYTGHLKGNIATGSLFLLIILILIGVGGAMMTRGLVPTNIPRNSGVVVTPVFSNPSPGQDNLQLYTFGFASAAPTQPILPTPPGETCQTQIKPPTCTACTHGDSMICREDQATCDSAGGIYTPLGWYEPQYTCAYIKDFDEAKFNQKKTDPNCVEACIAKPVIYLYPLVSTFVDVLVKVPGKIFISDPLYPEGGWKDVLAHPDGSLLYQGKKYKELFFESDVDKVNPPDNGIVIAKKDLQKTLSESVTRLGLQGAEKDEFLDFWLPLLNDLDTPYVLFSILDPVEKERVDHVEITPKPDTFIGFIAYFKPLESKPSDLKPLELPESPPERIGFTAVEWGGTIDH
jgi:hypothetical protein